MKLGIRRPMAAALTVAMSLVLAQGVGGAAPAQAVCIKGMGRWLNNTYTPYIDRSIPPSWNPSVTAAISRWNGIPGSKLHYNAPQFNMPNTTRQPFMVNLWSFYSGGFPDVPGMAIRATTPNHNNVVVSLNSDFYWNASGVTDARTYRVDIQTVLVHEVGHASGLAHPYREICGAGHPTAAEKPGVMNVTWTTKRVPNADDKSGIAARY